MKSPDGKRWIVPTLIGVATALAVTWSLFIAFRVAAPKAGPKKADTPEITFVPTVTKGRDAELFELEPLFLPTAHNTSVLPLPPHLLQEPGSMAFNYEPKFTISESAGGVQITDPIPVPSKLVDVLSLGEPPNPFPEVGRVDVTVPDLPPRFASLEVLETRTGKPVLEQDIAPQPGLTPPAGDWAPVEFLVAVDRAGLVGSPVPAESIGSDEVENFFRDYLAKKFQLGARLAPGFYTVRIGP